MSAFSKDQLLSASPTYQFEISYLQLCQLSYLAQPVTAIPANISKVQPFDPGGRWTVGWGPVLDSWNANLVYVATLYSGSYPILAAVVVRGTDLGKWTVWSDLKQAFEDLMVPFQSNLPWMPSDSPIQVADGTLDALSTIQGLADPNGASLWSYLQGFLGNPANDNPLLVVTGHSLGGCLTTVVAPWLQQQIKGAGMTTPIVPTTFAAPTAGNGAFADYYANIFQYAPRYFNSLDIVPFAWWNLPSLCAIYDNNDLNIPWELYGVVIGFEGALDATGASYSQAPTNNAQLPGLFNATFSQDWAGQASYQHHSTTYMSLLGGQSVISTEPTDLLSLVAHQRPRAKRGPPDLDIIRKLAARHA